MENKHEFGSPFNHKTYDNSKRLNRAARRKIQIIVDKAYEKYILGDGDTVNVCFDISLPIYKMKIGAEYSVEYFIKSQRRKAWQRRFFAIKIEPLMGKRSNRGFIRHNKKIFLRRLLHWQRLSVEQEKKYANKLG